MANRNPIVPTEAGKATRFAPGYDPRRMGRKISTHFIVEKLAKERADGRTPNDDIVDHLIEAASKWEVIVVGKGSDGELLKVASARDSVKAAEVLWSYALGKPTTGGTVVPPPNVDPRRETLDIAMEVYRDRLMAGEMGEAELAGLTQILMGAEKAEAELIARILGDRKGVSKALRERAEALLARLEGRQIEVAPAGNTSQGQLTGAPVDEPSGGDKPCP